MKARITFSPQALEQARAAATWWRENRSTAPRLFAIELRSTLLLLANAPNLGVRFAHGEVLGLRRILLSSTRYHVYYRHDERASLVEIVAIWNAVRGRRPRVKP